MARPTAGRRTRTCCRRDASAYTESSGWLQLLPLAGESTGRSSCRRTLAALAHGCIWKCTCCAITRSDAGAQRSLNSPPLSMADSESTLLRMVDAVEQPASAMSHSVWPSASMSAIAAAATAASSCCCCAATAAASSLTCGAAVAGAPAPASSSAPAPSFCAAADPGGRRCPAAMLNMSPRSASMASEQLLSGPACVRACVREGQGEG